MKVQRKKTVCEWKGIQPCRPTAGSKLFLATETIGKTPINGLRKRGGEGIIGWYLWCGEEAPLPGGAFTPLAVERITEYLPEAEEYLLLPPGYRFLIDDTNYEDAWYDETLLDA